MKKLSAFLCSLACVFGVVGTANGNITWDWSFSSEAGQFITDGDISTPGTYTMIDFSVTQSTVGGTIGSLSGGEYVTGDYVTIEPYSFVWNGNSVTNWLHSGFNTAYWWVFTDVSHPLHCYEFGVNSNTNDPFEDPTQAEYDDLNQPPPAIIVLASGTVNVAPSVPIPSAIWLLGSGLIGLVGFRRKFGRRFHDE